jgi:hypothetical protein
MRATSRAILMVAVIAGWCLVFSTPSASAQRYGAGSLGGYGAAPSFANPSMSGSSPMIIPYGGMFEGFMPGRTGGGSALSFRSRPSAAMGSARTSFSLAPMSGGMTSMSGGMGRGPGARNRAMSPLGGGGMGLGGGTGLGGMSRMQGPGGTSVMPPSIGYPFRQPPSLLTPSGPAAGMSM